MNPYKKFAKDIGLMGFTQVILGLEAFLLLPLLTKFLGATNYGIWSQIKITVSLLSGFAILGLGAAVVRFISGQEDKKKLSREFISVLLITIITASIFGSIIFIFSNKIGLLLTHVAYSGFFFKFVILMLLLRVVHSLFTAFFRAKENVKLYSTIEIARVVLELGLVYIFLSNELGLLGVVGAFILAKMVVIFFCLGGIKKYITFVKPSFKAIKPYLSFGIPFTITPLLFWVLQAGDQYVIGYFIGAKAVGIYALAYSLSRIVRILFDPVQMVLFPALSRAWNRGDREAAKIFFKYSYKYTFMIVIPAMLGLSMLAEPVLRIISTKEFIEGQILIPIITAGVAVYVFFQLALHLLMLMKKTKKIAKILLVLAMVNIFLNILLVPLLGSLGAAISTFLVFGIAAIIGIKLIRSMGFSLRGNFLFKCLFSSGLMGVTILILKNLLIMNEIIKMSVIILVSIVVYFLILFLLKGISKKELEFFRTLFKNS